jgi:hypothetical protein
MAEEELEVTRGTGVLKMVGMLGAGIVFIVGTAFGAMTFLDNQHVQKLEFVNHKVESAAEFTNFKIVNKKDLTALAFNANQAFIDTQYMVNQRELRWMDEMPVEKMSQGTKRHYKYLQESQTDLEKRKLELRKAEKKENAVDG